MCGRYYVDDDTAGEIEKVIRQVTEKLQTQKAGDREGIVAERTAGQWERESVLQKQELWENKQLDIPFGDIYPAALAPVLGAGMETAGYRTLHCRMLRWGLPGYPPKGSGKKGQVIFNARSETAMEKPTFREGIKNHRIVIPAAGFYEWNCKKEKFRFRRTDSSVLFMAGCFRHYEDGDRFVILTTAANASMEPVHDRMPLILEQDEITDWIWDGERTKHLLEKQPCLLERTTDYEQMTLF